MTTTGFTQDEVTNYRQTLQQLNVLIQSAEADIDHLQNLEKEDERQYLQKLENDPATPKPRNNWDLVGNVLFRLNEHKTRKIALLEHIVYDRKM